MTTDGGARTERQMLEELLDWRHDLSGTVEQDEEIEQVRAWVDGLTAQVAAMREVLRVVAEPTPAARTPEQLRAILTAQRRAAQEVLRDGRR